MDETLWQQLAADRQADHDLLIEMRTKLDMLITSDRDVESRLKKVELWVSRMAGLGVIGVPTVAAICAFVVQHFAK
jgi:hypothetical protein